MEYAGVLLIILIILIIKSEYNKKVNIKNQREYLDKTWGKCPTREYTSEQYENIKYMYKNKLKNDYKVDDITWNDLNMDSIFMMMNNTQSAIGEEYLYNMLRDVKFDNDVLKERSRLADYFSQNKKDRINVQMLLSQMGKPRNISISEYIDKTKELNKHNSIFNRLMGLFLVFSLVLTLVKPSIGIALSIIMVGNNIVFYYKRKAQIENYLTCFVYIIKMLNIIKKLNKLNIDSMSKYTDELTECSKCFSGFRKNAWLIISGDGMKGSLEDMILDYVRILFHIDLVKFDSMLLILQKNEQMLQGILNNLGYIDSMIAVASFRNQIGSYTEPILFHRKRPYIEIADVFHPILDNPVLNSLKQEGCVLLTGSNASGKSTFLKTVAINAILSQTIFTSVSSYYKAVFYKIYSSMALRDDILSSESYYIVEIKSLKRILDEQGKDIPVLCFVDEVLRGTNTIERISASSEILYNFTGKNTICFAATHDIELTYILEDSYTNYHFQEDVIGNDIKFDYKLYKGRATSRNAIKLLDIIGYNKNIIDRANSRAQKFIDTNKWIM